jgi:hypothetical protein
LEWRAWARIRGGDLGIGPQRQDFHASFIAFHAEQRRKSDATLADFMMPWITEEPVHEEDED